MALTGEKGGPKSPCSVLVRQQEREHRCRSVARTAVQFQLVCPARDDHPEENLLSNTVIFEGELGHGADIVADTRNILAWLRQRLFDNHPDNISASKGVLPMLLDGIDLAQVHEDSVLDGLFTRERIDRIAEHVFRTHGLMPFGAWGVCHGS